MAIPTGSQQNSGTPDVVCVERFQPDRSRPDVQDERGKVRAALQGECREVVSIAVAVGWCVQIRARVADHLDASDGELGTFGVHGRRLLEAEVFVDQWSWQAGVGDHPVLDDVAQIDQRHAQIIAHRDQPVPLAPSQPWQCSRFGSVSCPPDRRLPIRTQNCGAWSTSRGSCASRTLREPEPGDRSTAGRDRRPWGN
jgi:hypothetical protein